MFGKKSKMSANDRAVMAMGRANGNLKGPGAPFNKKMALSTSDTAPRGKAGPNPYRARAVSPGKAGPVKLTVD